MEQLGEALISHIGTFLSYNDRLRCLETSKLFKSINYTFKGHSVDISKDPDLFTHLPYIKTIKPKLNELFILCSNQITLSPKHQNDIISMSEYANAQFPKVNLIIKNCSIEFIQNMLHATKIWSISRINIAFNENEKVHPDIIKSLQQRSNLVLHIKNEQLPILDDSRLLQCVSALFIHVYCNDRKKIVINTEHLNHMNCVWFTTNGHVCLTHPQNITNFMLYDMMWETEEHPLLQTIQNVRNGTEFVMKEHIDSIKTCHVRNNFWYNIMMKAPKDCRFHYEIQLRNACIIPIAKKMASIGGDRFALMYKNDDEYLLSKVVQHFVPNVKANPSNDFVKGLDVREDASLAELYALMSSNIAKDVWSWLDGLAHPHDAE